MENGAKSSSSLKSAVSWSRYYSEEARQHNTLDSSRNSMESKSPVPEVVSPDSILSDTVAWTPSDEELEQDSQPEERSTFFLDTPDKEDTGQSSARKWSWRVNRHDTRISPSPELDVDDTPPLAWHEMDTFDTVPEQESVTKVKTLSKKSKKKKNKQRKRRESLGTNLRGKLGFFTLVVHDFRVWWSRYWRSQWELPVFRSAINTTESHFGSSVVSLFIFTRWIFILNLCLAIIWFFFVVFPNILFFPYQNMVRTFRLTNLLDGKGILGESWMFYGHYPKKINDYHLDFAYLLTILITYFGSFFIILKGIAEARSHSELETQTTRHKFSTLMFSSWDHSITSRDAVNVSTLGIINTFQDLVVEEKAHAAILLRSRAQTIKVRVFRALAWIITIILIGGACTGIIMLVIYVNFADVPHSESSNNTVIESTGFMQVYGTTLIFSLVNIFVPMVITRAVLETKCLGQLRKIQATADREKLPQIEHYSTGKMELLITLARVFCLRMANLIALLFSLYDTIQHVVDDQQVNTDSSSGYGCVGTVIGQELYKLVVMDTLVHATVNLSMYFCRYYWTCTKLELHLPSAILVIIYRQALIWVGTLACPVMPLIGLMSNSVFFGVNYLIVHKTCKPPEKRWNQSRHSAFFLKFLLFSLLILIPPVSFVVGSNSIALGKAALNVPNGPFGLNQPTAAFTRFRTDLPDWFEDSLSWIMSDVVLLPSFLLLITIVLYLKLLVGHTVKQTIYLKADLAQEREENKNMAKRLRFLQHMELINKARSPGKTRFQ